MEPIRYNAAGGVVVNDRGEILLLERDVPREGEVRHEVRLPKGHIDEGETAQEAALREVCEESGYCDLVIIATLPVQEVEYQFRGEHYQRTEHYFLMHLARDERSAVSFNDPESEEVLYQVSWSADFAVAIEQLTYDGEKEIMRRAARAWERVGAGM